jgi:hypothetical protein
MKNRFDLEHEIRQTHAYADQLDMVCDYLLNESSDKIDVDHIVNTLTGLRILIDMHTDKLFDTMCQVCELDSYKETI